MSSESTSHLAARVDCGPWCQGRQSQRQVFEWPLKSEWLLDSSMSVRQFPLFTTIDSTGREVQWQLDHYSDLLSPFYYLVLHNKSTFDVKAVTIEIGMRDSSRQIRWRGTKRTYDFPRQSKIEVFNVDISSITPVTAFIRITHEERKAPTSAPVCSLHNLSQDLEKIFLDETFADMKLRCHDMEFKCHSMLLAGRSPVFKAMLQSSMTEAQSKTVHIEDIEPEVLKAMLLFMYTGTLPLETLQLLATDLLAAAEKYQLDHLKSISEQVLCKKLEINNCMEYLVVADMHQANALKKQALELLVKHKKTVFATGEWKKILVPRPDLWTEVTEALVMQ